MFPSAPMPLSIRRQRNYGYGGRKHPWRRPLYQTLSQRVARRDGGGIAFVEDEAVLAAVRRDLGLPSGPPLAHYVDEVLEDRPLVDAFEAARRDHGRDEDPDWPSRVKRLRGILAVYYAALREMRPSVVVETGTAAGSLTSFVAAALARNDHGRLVSIDIPPVAGRLTMDTTVAPPDIGYFIPEPYRERWTYVQGDAKRHLPRVLVEEAADVFIHDSLHTTTHMLFEYSVARALMRPGSLIVSDDILWNDAFNTFLRANGLFGYAPFSNPGTGVAVNRFDAFERESGLGLADAGPDD